VVFWVGGLLLKKRRQVMPLLLAAADWLSAADRGNSAAAWTFRRCRRRRRRRTAALAILVAIGDPARRRFDCRLSDRARRDGSISAAAHHADEPDAVRSPRCGIADPRALGALVVVVAMVMERGCARSTAWQHSGCWLLHSSRAVSSPR
jgi:hypothetical protein